MRPPSEMRTVRRGVTRGRVAIVVFLVVLFLVASSLRGIAGFYTDFLWFDSIGFASVWRRVLTAQVGLVAIATAVFALFMFVNLAIADRLAPDQRPDGPEEEVLARYHELVGRRRLLLRSGASLLFGLIAGLGVSNQWENWLLFLNQQDFDIDDPQFGMDVGFYVFRLPFLSFLVSWGFASILIVTIVTAVAHYVNGGIRVQTEVGSRVTPQVKAHLSLLLGLLALIKAGGYYLNRFELTLSTRGFVDGAGYTDLEAQLPALNLLILISLFAFVLLIVNIRLKGFTIPILAVGLWALVAVVAGSAVPAFIQRFRVDPAESTREAQLIERNIEATRAAMNLDEIVIQPYRYTEELTADAVADSRDTIDAVRLLDPGVVEDTFQRLEGVRSFYDFRDVDVDRYEINGEVTPVVLSARELEEGGLPNRSWESRHIANTHGYGVALAPSNVVDPNGRPNFAVSGVPIDAGVEPALTQPRLYYGEDLGGYAVVGAERDEVDFQTEDDVTSFTRYDGDGGVGIGNLVRRAAFSLRFADTNLLISSEITPQSRILFTRDIVERVEKLAPFLHLDADPYPVIVEGRVQWVVDAYTTTDRYPFAQRAANNQLTPGSGLRTHSFNYVRNSVKAVVDAYDGSVTLYAIDPDDPLVGAYQAIFPDLFAEGEPPLELAEHFRYPEDLFRVQTNMWGRYRIDTAAEFYDATGAWNVAQAPSNLVGGTQAVQETDAQGNVTTFERRIDPQYLFMELPGDTGVDPDEEFVLFRPFVPFSDNDLRKELTGFMVARSDPGRYGQLLVYEVQAAQLPDGPAQFDSNVNTDAQISQEISLLNQQGSRVLAGNVLLVPVGESIIYVRPLYLAAEGTTPLPELQRVIVGFGDRIVMRESFEEALQAAVLGGASAQPDQVDPSEPDEPSQPSDPEPDDPGTDADVATLLSGAADAFDRADEALRSGDLALYQEQVARAQRLVERAVRLQGGDDPEPATTTTIAET